MTRLVVHIDKLVLRGVARGDAAAFSDALQQELQRVLAERGQLRPLIDGGDRARLAPARTTIAAGSGAAATGRQVANTVAWRMRS